MKKILLSIFAGIYSLSVAAQEPTLVDTVFFRLPSEITNEYLDSIKLSSDKNINNYSLIGVYGGGVFTKCWFNPTRDTQAFFNAPVYGFSYTLHGKLFGFLPYFGLEVGFQHNYEGYLFKADEDTGYVPNVQGAEKAIMECYELPLLLHGHADMNDNFKLLIKVGIYGGYRTAIQRFDTYGSPIVTGLETTFNDTDYRWSYGLMGGLGVGFMFAPFEFHINADVKWGWGSFYEPDYASKYYYRFAYPLDLVLKAGLYYQLTPRTGYTRKQLKKFAKQIVYGTE